MRSDLGECGVHTREYPGWRDAIIPGDGDARVSDDNGNGESSGAHGIIDGDDLSVLRNGGKHGRVKFVFGALESGGHGGESVPPLQL